MSAPSHTNTLPTRTIPGTLIPTWTPHFKAFIYLVYHQRIWGIWWTISLLHPSVDEEKSLNRLIENWKQKKWKKRQKQDVGGQFTTENPKITLFSLAFFFPLYHIKKTQAFASVDLLLLCFWLCSFKAFIEFSLWRKHRERKQHRVSKNTSCCNCGSFSIHKSHLCFLHWNRISTCLFFCLTIWRYKHMCLSRTPIPNSLEKSWKLWGVRPHSAASHYCELSLWLTIQSAIFSY